MLRKKDKASVKSKAADRSFPCPWRGTKDKRLPVISLEAENEVARVSFKREGGFSDEFAYRPNRVPGWKQE